MTTIQNNVTPTTNSSSSTSKISKDLLGQDDFLKLMIAQMKNQDPTKPLEGQEYLGQLAQFSTLNSIQELQKSFDTLAQSLTNFQTTQATNLVGQQVLVDSDKAYYVKGDALSGQVNLPAGVQNLQIKVYAANGELVNTVNLGQKPAGLTDFSLDSETMASGVYRITAEGVVDGKAQQFSTKMWNWVESVSVGQGGQSSALQLAGGVGNASMNSIYGIR